MDSDIYIHKRVSEVDGGFAKPHHGDAFCIRRLSFFTSFSSRVRGGPFVFAVEDLAAPHVAGGGGGLCSGLSRLAPVLRSES